MLSVPSLETLTRVGFAARGVMYFLIGYLSLRFGREEDGPGAISQIAEGNGKLVVGAMAVGFLGYGIWRLSEALMDTEGNGSDAKGAAVRAGGAVSGITHVGLAFLAARLATGNANPHTGSGAEQGAATALAVPGGALLLVLAGAALVLTGLWQVRKAIRADFLRHLDGRAAGRPWVKWLGRSGYAARGLVFLVVGWFLAKAGLTANASEAGGFGAAIAALPGELHVAVPLGFLLFGLFSLVESRYRRIRDSDVLQRLISAAREARA